MRHVVALLIVVVGTLGIAAQPVDAAVTQVGPGWLSCDLDIDKPVHIPPTYQPLQLFGKVSKPVDLGCAADGYPITDAYVSVIKVGHGEITSARNYVDFDDINVDYHSLAFDCDDDHSYKTKVGVQWYDEYLPGYVWSTESGNEIAGSEFGGNCGT